MNEAGLKKAQSLELRRLPGALVFRHEDQFTAGIPDTSVTWLGRTTWLETKFLNPRLISKEIQKITAAQLAQQGKCFFVLYDARYGQRCTRIVHPLQILDGSLATAPDLVVPGFDHRFVAQFIRRLHDHQ